MRTKPIANYLPNVLRSIEGAYKGDGHRIWEVWADAVGPELARRSAPLEFKKGRLTIAVEGASWIQQMVFLGPAIIESVNRKLGQSLVKSVKAMASEVPAPPEEKPKPKLLDDGPLTAEEQAELDTISADIEDQELVKAIRDAREAAFRRRKALPPQE